MAPPAFADISKASNDVCFRMEEEEGWCALWGGEMADRIMFAALDEGFLPHRLWYVYHRRVWICEGA